MNCLLSLGIGQPWTGQSLQGQQDPRCQNIRIQKIKDMVNTPHFLDKTLEFLLLPQSTEVQNLLWESCKFSRKLAFHSQSNPDLWDSAFLHIFLFYTIESQCRMQFSLQFPGVGDGEVNHIEYTMCQEAISYMLGNLKINRR